MLTLTVLILMVSVELTGSVCNFPPDLTGVWIHSSHGDLSFITSSKFLMSIEQYQNVPGNCHTQVNDNTFIVVSDTLRVTLSQNVVVNTNIGICLKMEKIKTNLYKLTHLTSELALANARVALVFDPANVQVASVCNDNTTHAQTEYNLLMKKGLVDSVRVDCPNDIQGIVDVNMPAQNCLGKMDNCAEKSQITITDSSCNGEIAYTNNNTIVCVYDTSTSGSNVLWTYNMDTSTDETTRFRFTCFVYEVNVTAFTGTQNPKFCDFTQTSSSVTSTLGRYINGNVSSCDQSTTTDITSTTDDATTTDYVTSTGATETTTIIVTTESSTTVVTDTVTTTVDPGTTSRSSSSTPSQTTETSTSTDSHGLSTTTNGNTNTPTQPPITESSTQTQPPISDSSTQTRVQSTTNITPTQSSQSQSTFSSTQTTIPVATSESADLFTGIIASAIVGGVVLIFIVIFVVVVSVYCITRHRRDQNKRSNVEAPRSQRTRTKRSNNFDRISEPRDYHSQRYYPSGGYVSYSGSYQGQPSRDQHKSHRHSHHKHKETHQIRDLDSRKNINYNVDPRTIDYSNPYDASRDYYSYPMSTFSR